MGHQYAFLRPRLRACYRFSQGTFAGTRGNDKVAPKPDTKSLRFELGPMHPRLAFDGAVRSASGPRFLGLTKVNALPVTHRGGTSHSPDVQHGDPSSAGASVS